MSAESDIVEYFAQLIKNTRGLRQLHLTMINFAARRIVLTPMPFTQRLLIVEDILKSAGNAVSNSEIDSLAFDGLWDFRGEFWTSWHRCFNRLRSLTLSGFDAFTLLWRTLAPQTVAFECLEEFRFYLPCHYHGTLVRCEWAKNFSPCCAMVAFLKPLRLRHLTLCGIDKKDLATGFIYSGDTLRSLRYHVENSCSVQPLDAGNLKFMNHHSPNIEWLGIDLAPEAFNLYDHEKFCSKPNGRQLLYTLLDFRSLRELSVFVEGRQSSSFSIANVEVILAFLYLRGNKSGVPLENMTVTCINHIWIVQALTPSRTVLRSFSRDRPQEGYLVQLWDKTVCLQSEKETLGLPPPYEFGLSKWEIEGTLHRTQRI